MPQLVVVASRSAEKPADVKVRFHATGASGDRVVIVHPGGSAGSALRSKSTDGAVDGTLRFGTDGLAPGSYPAALVHPGRRHRVPVAVLALAAGAEPTVRTSRRLYTSGNPIRVSWTKGPGHEVGLARNLQGRRAPRIRTPRPARPTHVRTGTTSSTSTRTRRSRARRGSTPLRRYRLYDVAARAGHLPAAAPRGRRRQVRRGVAEVQDRQAVAPPRKRALTSSCGSFTPSGREPAIKEAGWWRWGGRFICRTESAPARA